MGRRERHVDGGLDAKLTIVMFPTCTNRTIRRIISVCLVIFVSLAFFNVTRISVGKTRRGPTQEVTRPQRSESAAALLATGAPRGRASQNISLDYYTKRFFRPTYPKSKDFVVFKGGEREELTFRKNPAYVPSKCPTSVWHKMSNMSRDETIYHPELHILMNSNLMNRSEYNRLAPFWMPFGYKYKVKVDYERALSTLKLFPAENSIFRFSTDNPRKACLSCAVIGNGGILHGSKKGQEIDAHDMIFRLNHAVRRNHETDVGNRTTHYFFYDRSLRSTSKNDVPRDKGIIYIFVPFRGNDYTYITSVGRGKDPKMKVLGNDIRILHPDFVRYLMKIWVNTPGRAFRPTTGALMFLTALHAGCDQISVYGMGYNYDYSLYYYDKKFQRTVFGGGVSHDRRSELAILKGLDRVGVIDWYKRDVAFFHVTVHSA